VKTGPVIDALERAPAIVVPLIREMPPQLMKLRLREGRWSVHEHACHLAVVHALFFERLDLMLASPAPVIALYDPADAPDDALMRLDLDRSLRAYVRDRKRLVARLRKLSPRDWRRTADHEEYGHYSVFIMFRHLALHDFLHAYRIEAQVLSRELLMRREPEPLPARKRRG
jgi:DinB family protein